MTSCMREAGCKAGCSGCLSAVPRRTRRGETPKSRENYTDSLADHGLIPRAAQVTLKTHLQIHLENFSKFVQAARCGLRTELYCTTTNTRHDAAQGVAEADMSAAADSDARNARSARNAAYSVVGLTNVSPLDASRRPFRGLLRIVFV